jgi:hypothetical protein
MPREQLIQIRRGSSTEWMSSNPILAVGENGFEIDTGRLKIGNGLLAWTDLDYIGSKEYTIRVKNVSGSAIYKGQAVYLDSYNASGSVPTIQLFAANGSNKQKFVGLLDNNVMNDNYGIVIYNGIISGLNTLGNSITSISVGGQNWSNGDTLYIDALEAGKLTKIKPKNGIIAAIILYANDTNGSLLVQPFVNPNLSDLSDVHFNSLNSDNIIKYNNSNSLWQNSEFIDGGII